MSRPLIGRIGVGLGMAAIAALPLQAQSLAVPVMEHATEDWDTCGQGQVHGLKSDGDGFLAVRTGPGSQFDKIDEVHNTDKVFLFDQHGDWFGVLYGVEDIDCSPITGSKPAVRPGAKSGWVHRNWVRVIAG